MICSREQLADVLGRSPATLDNMVREGMPFLSRPVKGVEGGKAWQFDSARCIEWFVKREAPNAVKNTEKEHLALRVQRAETTLIEAKAAAALKSVVLVSDAVRLYEEKASVVKSLVRAIPGRVAGKVAAETDPAKVLLLLKVEINAALESIKNSALKEAVKDLAKSGETDGDSNPVPVLVGPGEPDAPATPGGLDYDGY